MRTAILTVRNEDDAGTPWTETYTESDGTRMGLRPEHTDVEAWARGVIDYFNSTISNPRIEPRRVLVSVSVTDDGVAPPPALVPHDWHKTNAITISDRHGVYDAMRCSRCGVTGKRFGVEHVRRDAKFKAKRFDRCSGGQ